MLLWDPNKNHIIEENKADRVYKRKRKDISMGPGRICFLWTLLKQHSRASRVVNGSRAQSELQGDRCLAKAVHTGGHTPCSHGLFSFNAAGLRQSDLLVFLFPKSIFSCKATIFFFSFASQTLIQSTFHRTK